MNQFHDIDQGVLELQPAVKMKNEKKNFHFQEKEKQWRQQNLTIARMEAQRNEELRRVRAEQMRQREEIAAISVSYHKF